MAANLLHLGLNNLYFVLHNPLRLLFLRILEYSMLDTIPCSVALMVICDEPSFPKEVLKRF